MTESDLPARFTVIEALEPATSAGLWRARDTLLGREVLLERPFAAAGADRERSLREARALARVKHASVPRLFDVLETERGPLLVLEPLEGETLSDRLAREGLLPPAEARRIALALASALEAVHALGIVHRGVSAPNVVLKATEGEGSVVLAGFGFAKSGPGASSVPGTTFVYRRDGRASERPIEPPHPAPEQIRGEAADARADVFGLGWVLYECLTGRPPYAIELDVRHWRAPRAAHEERRGISRELSEIASRCLEIDPAKRFASASAVRGALESAEARAGGRRKTLVAASALVTLLAASFGVRALLRAESPAGSTAGERGAALAPRATATTYQPRYVACRALLVGIGAVYAQSGFPALANAERDVDALAERLGALAPAGRPKWDVAKLRGGEATRKAILAALNALRESAGPDDMLLVYYAGHGEPASGPNSGYVIPALAPTAKDDPSRAEWIRFDEFAHVFDETKAKHVLVAMDCCYGGRLGESETIAMRSSARAYEEAFLRERAHVVITSGRPNEEVSDGVEGGHSPFAAAFLAQLARGDEAVTSSEVFVAVQKELTGALQQPRLKRPTAGADGEIVFFLR